MKRLLVGLDFSKGALHAFDYALEIAKVTQAQIRLVWVDDAKSNELAFSKNVSQGRNEAKRNFDELFEQYKDHPVKNRIDYRLLKGKVGPEIARHAKEYGADLVIAGSHGITGYEEYWIGSNANRIVIYNSSPTITVRYDYEFKKNIIEKILIPIDNTSETLQKIPFTAKMAAIFNSEVHLLGVYSTVLQSMHKKVNKMMEEADNYLNDKNINHKKGYMETDNITSDMLKYIENNNIDLVSIMTEQETTANNMLLGKFAYQIVNNSSVPVLSIHATENFTLSL